MTVIQTRTGSTRFPGKVLRPLGGTPAFVRMVERVKRAWHAGTVVVATTDLPKDDIIEYLCMLSDISCYRGHPTDLLDRHYRAALSFRADAVVKIPSDCPLIDHRVIDRVLEEYLTHSEEVDYVSNLHPATYPDGNDVEVVSMEALTAAWLEAKRDFEREHTTPFIWDRPERFRVRNIAWETGRDCSLTHRWTLDYPEDYELIKAVYGELSTTTPDFGVDEITRLLDGRPDLRKLNERYVGVAWYNHHRHELKTLNVG